MKIKSVLLSLVVVLGLWMPMGMATAQSPNTKEDNACYEGGSMAGKCDTEWEWVCGWYLAQWQTNGGWDNPANPFNPFNDACVSLLPPRPEPVSVVVAGPLGPNCVFFPAAVYLNFNGGFVLPTGATWYSDANCTVILAPGPFPMVYASSPAAALALCQSNFAINNVSNTGNPNLFACV